MSFNGKHLSLEDRKIIEENINKRLRKFETAQELNKSQSTIGKEIKNNSFALKQSNFIILLIEKVNSI